MPKTRLTARNRGATIKAPNEPTGGSGPRAKPTRSFLLNILRVVRDG